MSEPWHKQMAKLQLQVKKNVNAIYLAMETYMHQEDLGHLLCITNVLVNPGLET